MRLAFPDLEAVSQLEYTRRPRFPFDLHDSGHSAIITDKFLVYDTISQPMSLPSQALVASSQSGSILDVALNEYKKTTGKDLLSHPLSVELQPCDSVDSILAVLQRQANTLEQRRDGYRGLMKWISSSVNILYSVSATLGDGISLVRVR